MRKEADEAHRLRASHVLAGAEPVCLRCAPSQEIRQPSHIRTSPFALVLISLMSGVIAWVAPASRCSRHLRAISPDPSRSAPLITRETPADAAARGQRRTWHAPCVLQASRAYGLSVSRRASDRTSHERWPGRVTVTNQDIETPLNAQRQLRGSEQCLLHHGRSITWRSVIHIETLNQPITGRHMTRTRRVRIGRGTRSVR